jgi:hypothetical protein
MNIMRWLILSLTLILSAGFAAPVSAYPASISCAGVFSNLTIPGDLIVPEGEYCELNSVTVLGDAQVGRRSTLAVYGGRIAGALRGSNVELVLLQGASVGGRIRLVGGATARLEYATVAGDTRIADIVDTRVLQTQLAGDLVVRGGREVVQFCGTTVAGDAQFARNKSWVGIGGDLATCTANEVWGNLRVHHNLGGVMVANNTIGRNLVCAANDPAPAVYGNQVGGRARGQCGAGEPVSVTELGDGE